MAEDHDVEMSDEEFWETAIVLTDAAVCSSSTNPTQPPPQSFPPPPPPHYAPPISYSPPRELSQRVKEENHRNFPNKGLDCPVSLNGFNRNLNSVPPFPQPPRLHDEDKCSKQHEINRLKEELGRVSKVLTSLEQECLELRKDREKNEKHLRSVVAVNGCKDAEALSCTKKSNLKNKDPFEEGATKSAIHCKAVGVQTDDHAISTIKEKLSVTYHSRKLADIWEPGNDQQPRNNIVSKLFVACGSDLQLIFGCLGLNNIPPSKKTTTKMDSSKLDLAPSHCIQPFEAAKVSQLYLTLTKISYDTGRLDYLLDALVDLCQVQNTMIVDRCLCVLHVVLKHILNMENKGSSSRDNVMFNDSGKHMETEHVSTHLTRLISGKKVDGSKWFPLFQTIHQIITRHSEESIIAEAVSIMNILLLRTDAYTEREMYGEVAVFETISQLLRKEAGVGVQKQTVDLLYLLLNCPKLMVMLCSSCKEEGTSADVYNTESAPAFKGLGAILDGLADCLACRGNSAPVLKVQRKAMVVLAFLAASSGRHGIEILLGRYPCKRVSFLLLILEILASEIDVEASDDDFRERRLVIREALILLNRVASNSTPVLRLLTNRRDVACLTIHIATRLSQKVKHHHQSDPPMRESEIVDLARIFKKRVFTFLGDTIK